MSHGNVANFTRVMVFGRLCVALLCFGAPAAANERAMAQACRADARKLCPGMRPGDGRIAACLHEIEGQLSSERQAQLGKAGSCAAEMKKLCAEAQGESEKRHCAKDKRTDLSAGCRAAAGG